ncbi:MAG: minor capsid protein (endogenous virus) [Lactobacillus phage ViSo-2018b]|nr:MAG: minor capsid protein [Lactobacillus phage ViSo-2018b]
MNSFYADGQARWTGDVDSLDITINFNDGVLSTRIPSVLLTCRRFKRKSCQRSNS